MSIPAGTALVIPYILCAGCLARLLLNGDAKQDVLLAVELRIGPTRGTA
jgi:hypothetical protein